LRAGPIVILAVVVAAACGAQPGIQPGAVPSPAPSSPPAALAHLVADRIGFDYPAAWTQRTPPPGAAPPFGGLTFIGTAPSTGGCRSTGPNSSTCGPDFQLTPGSVSVAVYWQDGPMVIDPFAPVSDPGPGTHRVMIDNVPATLTDVHASPFATGAREILLTLPGPTFTAPPIFVRAETMGPSDDVLGAQVAALLASVHYEPALHPTASMDAAAATTAAAVAVSKLRSDFAGTGGLPCFAMPGTPVSSAVLDTVPAGPELLKPLPVTCSTAIEGTAVEVWKFIVAISWTAAADRAAGSAELLTWVGLDGVAWPYDRTGDQIPYQN